MSLKIIAGRLKSDSRIYLEQGMLRRSWFLDKWRILISRTASMLTYRMDKALLI